MANRKTELKEKLENITGHKYKGYKNRKYDPVKPPVGILYVGIDEDNGWISGNWLFKDGISKSLII